MSTLAAVYDLVGDRDFSTEFTLEMLRNIDEVANHPDMTPELAEALSTSYAEIEYRGFDVNISPSRRARNESE